ncbi:protection of telomeres protein 1-like [Lytechinus variegatus]|uniref:protection of telomeres protein 1-like n=1 Tax=Lytechinus variegatus TaxID=7654 RepID=UPI001BB1852E|nr:protection of telomeres protein 1-like [Lytechinus variegatus]
MMAALKDMSESDVAPELSGLQMLPLVELYPSSSLLNRYVMGKIVDRSPLITKGKLPVLKFVLEESSSSCRINVYTFGDYATGIDAYKDGDTIFISNVMIERSHTFSKDNHHKCHLMVHKARSHARIWVCPQQNKNGNNAAPVSAATCTTTASTSTTGPTTSTGITKAQGDGGSVPGTPSKVTHGRLIDINAESSPNKSNRTYKYTCLNDIKETGSVDVYGVVKFFKPPYKTKGPDYCMSLTIVDPSLPEEDSGLKCVLFQQDIKKLPEVLSKGDIVRLHRLRIQKYNSDFQGAKGNGFSSLVFDGRPNTPLEPRSSSVNYTLTDQDKEKVRELRLWAKRQTSVPLAGQSWTLSQIVSREYFDLMCQVVAVAIIPAESCVLIKVWDGTKYKWPVRCLDVSKVQVKWDTELACRAEGLMLDVALYDNHMKAGRELKPGDFVRLYNLHAAPYVPPNTAPASTSADQDNTNHNTNMIELVLHRGTSYGRGLVVMKEYEEDVRVMKGRMEELSRRQVQPSSNGDWSHESGQSSCGGDGGQRMDSNEIELDNLDWEIPDSLGTTRSSPRHKNPENASWPSSFNSGQELQCMQKPISVITQYQDCQVSKIKQMKDHPPHLFRLKAAVVDYYPRTIQDFVHLFCSQCRMSCRIPSTRSASKSKPHGNTGQSSPDNDRKRKTAQGFESPRRSRRIKKQIGDSSDSSQERDKQRKKMAKCKGRQVTTKLTPQKNKENINALAYIKDLTVQESLSLMKEGMQLVRVPKLYMREARHHDKGRLSNRTQLYVCPTCCPDQHQDKDVVLLQYHYWIKLWLQDSTERVETILQGSDAELFFGTPATNLHMNPDSRLSIADKMERLCPHPCETNPDTDPPQVNSVTTNPKLECCVERLVSMKHGSRKVTYHMRDTQLALDVH